VPAELDPAEQWIARQREFWEARLDALGRYLEEDNARDRRAGTKKD
jgi:hypothetical protein